MEKIMRMKGRSPVILALAFCAVCLFFLEGCAQLSLTPSSLGDWGESLSNVSIFAVPNGETHAVWIVGGTPHRGEANIAYCKTSPQGDNPECIMVMPH